MDRLMTDPLTSVRRFHTFWMVEIIAVQSPHVFMCALDLLAHTIG
jgi:hypothetical protein